MNITKPNDVTYKVVEGLIHSDSLSHFDEDQRPVVKIQTMFAKSGTDVLDESRQLFIQLDVLVHFEDNQTGWKEMGRWLKYEETVEVGDRWSKPHVPTSSLGALTTLRKALTSGRCATGLGVVPTTKSGYDVAVEILKDIKVCQLIKNLVLSQLLYRPNAVMKTIKSGRTGSALSDEVCQRICNVLTRPHKHKHRTTVRTSKQNTENNEKRQCNRNELNREQRLSSASPDEEELTTKNSDNKQPEKSKKPLLRRRHGTGKDIVSAYYSYPPGVRPDNLEPYEPNRQLSKKLHHSTETANILIGQCDFLVDTIMAFCRLENAVFQADLTEVEAPTRFAFVLLGPTNSTSIWELTEIGRALAVLLNDRVFSEVAYHSSHFDDLLAGIDEFMDNLTVLPPSIWDRSVHLEPPGKIMTMDKIKRRLSVSKRGFTGPESPPQEQGASHDQSLTRTGRFFGGLLKDIRRRYPLYWSDIKDGFNIQSLASIIFLYFACITPIVTFGGLMGQKTDGYMGTMETLLSGAICGICYALFAGQPLALVGATGPLLIFESTIYRLCRDNALDFMAFRFWIGAWILLLILIIVAFDLSALVRYITRFIEESFVILVSVIFIVEAFTKIFDIWNESPVDVGVTRRELNFSCACSLPTTHYFTDPGFFNSTHWNSTQWPPRGLREDCVTASSRLSVRYGCVSEKDCQRHNWTLNGPTCGIHTVTGAVPDVFFFSFILFIGTFTVAMFFRSIRTGRYFPALMKTLLADFAVLLAVVICTGVDAGFGLNTPKLYVPDEFKPSRADRSWLINPVAVTYWWLIPLGLVPAIMGSILLVLEQQIVVAIVNRKEHKLVKGHGYHLDLLVIGVMIAVCSVLGLPWVVAATIRSITHVRSLMRQSDVAAPGERPQMLGVREQRFTGLCVHLLIGVSTLITGVLRLIPMPVLYGVFLYMGVTSLGGVQFVQRIAIMFMPVKYQPDYVFLRHVKTIRVHAFTGVQVVCSVVMWVIKSVNITSIAFPIMLILLMVIRKLLDYVFTQGDLYWLDHLLPDEQRREKEDRNNQLEESEDESNDVKDNNKQKGVVLISRKSSAVFVVEGPDPLVKSYVF